MAIVRFLFGMLTGGIVVTAAIALTPMLASLYRPPAPSETAAAKPDETAVQADKRDKVPQPQSAGTVPANPQTQGGGEASGNPGLPAVTGPKVPEGPAALPAPGEDKVPAMGGTEEAGSAQTDTDDAPAVKAADEPAMASGTEGAGKPPSGTMADGGATAPAKPVTETAGKPASGAVADAGNTPTTKPAANAEAKSGGEPMAETAGKPASGAMADAEASATAAPVTQGTGAATKAPMAEAGAPSEPKSTAKDTPDAGASAKAPPVSEPASSQLAAGGTKPAATNQQSETSTGPAAAAQTDNTAPLTRYAAAFENPTAKPVLAIVLIDTGAPELDRDALAALPFPVSFALNPTDPATPEYAALYRDAGREVVMLATGLAPETQAADAAEAVRAMGKDLPEAVAVMDLATPVFQNSRALSGKVVPEIGAEGRGILTWDKGLNAGDQVARREDVASAVIFRDLAMGGGDRAAAKRTLDRAVFKAGQDGRVVVAGEVTDELVAALLEWSVEGRAGAVAIAPLTAALKVD